MAFVSCVSRVPGAPSASFKTPAPKAAQAEAATTGKKLSALATAARVLRETGQTLTCPELLAAMAFPISDQVVRRKVKGPPRRTLNSNTRVNRPCRASDRAAKGPLTPVSPLSLQGERFYVTEWLGRVLWGVACSLWKRDSPACCEKEG
jgi:hypothetical protein